jgi:hypothetical protein
MAAPGPRTGLFAAPHRGRCRRAAAVVVSALLFAVLAPPGAAQAAWSLAGPGARAYVRADSLPLTGAGPTADQVGGSVGITWTQGSFHGQLLGARTYGGYRVNRYDVGGTAQSVGAGCAGVISGATASLNCTETGVPAGTWRYGITPVLGNWIGTEGSRSLVVLDTTAPVVTLTTPVNGSITNDTTPALSGAAGNSAGDAATVTVKVYSGTTATGSALQTLTPTRAGATWTVDATVLAPGTYTAQASQSDTAGNVGVSSANTFTLDVTAPSPVTVTAPVTGALTTSRRPTVSGAAGTAAGDSATVTVTIALASAPGTPVQTLAATRTGSTWSIVPGTDLSDGSYVIRATQSDTAGNTATSTPDVSLRVDATAPAGLDVQTANLAGTVGKPELGDTLTYTFSEAMAPASILSGWNGSATSVTVRLNSNGTNVNDTVEVWNSANIAQVQLGSVDLGVASYTHLVQSVTFTGSTMLMTGSTVTVTLGTASGVVDTAPAGGTDASYFMHWTPAATATDLAGNPMPTTVVVETGSLAAGTRDREF